MIKVLQSWIEIGEAVKFIAKKNLPTHDTPQKNWDLYHLYKNIELLPKNIKIIDIGCGEL